MKKTVNVEFVNINGVNKLNNITDSNKIMTDFNDTLNTNGVFFGEIVSDFNDQISLNSVSHTISKMWLEKSKLKSEITILNTQNGNILSELIEVIPVYFSARCIGVVDPLTQIVKIDKLISIDAIAIDNVDALKKLLREKKLKRILNED